MVSGPPVALITGASRGIGRGIAVELARLGHSVAINFASRRDAAEECRALCRRAAPPASKASFEIFHGDISRAEDRSRLLGAVRERF